MFREGRPRLIGSVDMDKGRERMLMKLADGKPYRYLAEKIFPEVMRVDYRIEYTRQQPDAAESLRMSRTGERQTLRLNELFAVAGSYPKGSTEYNDVLDLTARLFPDSPKPISMQRPCTHQRGNGQSAALSGEIRNHANRIQQHGHTLPTGRKTGQGGSISYHGSGSRHRAG